MVTAIDLNEGRTEFIQLKYIHLLKKVLSDDFVNTLKFRWALFYVSSECPQNRRVAEKNPL